MHDVPRRDFLARALRWGAWGAGTALGGVLLEGCAPSSTKRPVATTSLAVAERASAADWRRLAASLRGVLVRPSSPSYARDRLLFDAALAPRRPQGIAYCASNDDVARCVAFAREHAVPVTARSGGHSYAGYSANDGLIVDLSRLHSVDVVDSDSALVGAGTRLIDLYDSLAKRGRLVPGGSCASVGFAGLALGGGIGVLARRYGLTCDNILETTTVSADGSQLRVAPDSHPDLLWAQRGGGGGNFGVTTSFRVRTYPVGPLALFTLHFAWEAAQEVLMTWMHWIGHQADELWANCLLQSEGLDGLNVEVSGVWCGSVNDLATVVDSFVRALGTKPTSSFVGGEDYLHAMADEAGCSSLSLAACHLVGDGAGTLSRAAFRAKSSYVVAPWSDARVTRALNSLALVSRRAPDLGASLAFDSYGGAISRVDPAHSAFAHHDALAGIQATHSWSTFSSPTQIAAGDEWLRELGANVFESRDGAYVNYIDPTLEDWLDAYYGASVAKLVRVKSAVDPDDLFHFAQSIPVKSTTSAPG